MNIVVCQFYSENVKYGKLSEEINKKYCDDNGYTYYAEKDTEKLLDKLDNRSWTWYKPHLISEVMDKFEDCDYVLFLDIDAVLINHSRRIEEFIDDTSEIIMTEDYGPSIVNAGVMLIKNSLFSKNFLKGWWDICEEYPNYKTGLWHDQTCLKFMYDKLENKDLFKIIRPYDLNSRTFNLKSFIFHAFSYGNTPLRTIDSVHDYIFNEEKDFITLHGIAKKYPNDKDYTHDYYNSVYEKEFRKIKNEVKKFCEIGVRGYGKEYGWIDGNSLKVWRDYFKNAEILGLDNLNIDLDDSDRITTDYMVQSDLENVKSYSSKLSDYDIIIDDGTHKIYDQTITFAYFFRSLKSGGIYVIEDLNSSNEVNIPEKNNIWNWGEPGFITPLEMLQHFNKTKEIKNDYLTDDEITYLKENIESVHIYTTNPYSITSIIYKK